MLKGVIDTFLNSENRNKYMYLRKEIQSNEFLLKEYEQLSDKNLTFKNNIFNIINGYYNKCVVCNQDTSWCENMFSYRKTCSSKCSGKMLKIGKRKKILINTKEDFISYLSKGEIKITSIKNTKFYNQVINIDGNSLQEKAYKWIKNISESPICRNENCNNSVKYVNYSTGYREYCSIICSSTSAIKIADVKKTCLEKFGVDNVSKRNTHLNKYIEILKDFKIISYDDSIFRLYHNKCNAELEISRSIVYDRMNMKTEICTNCNKFKSHKSGYEQQLSNWLKSLSLNVIENDRTLIYPKELDIYLPDFNIAIEFNGLYWHSEKMVGKNYHIDKTNKCKDIDIDLIHIWEDDWIYKQDIIKSIILNRLGIITDRIYARKCEIRELSDNKIIKNFLNENHIQGYCKSSHKIGLFYQNELISLMTFGYRKTNSKKEFELIRFCNKINISVVGAASKLFKYYTKKYNPEFILSYADIGLFTGKLYENLGFKLKHISKPNYFWVVSGIRQHRWMYNKKRLEKMGFNISKTEVKIMEDNGYFRVFSCGQKRYEFEV